MTTHGRYTGILRDDLSYAFDLDAQAFPGVDFSEGLHRANMSRLQAVNNVSALTTQVMTSVPLYLRAGDVVTNLTFVSATSGLSGTINNWWFALYSPAGNLLAQTADQTSGAWAANTKKTLALSSPVTVSATGWHRAGIMAYATVATLAGVTLHNAVESGAIIDGELPLAATSGSSLTSTAPATIGALTAIAGVPMVIAT